MRFAWNEAVDQQQVDQLAPALESPRLFLEHTGWYSEAVALFGAAADVEQAHTRAGSPLLGRLLARVTWFQHRLDDFPAAEALISRGLAILPRAEPRLPFVDPGAAVLAALRFDLPGRLPPWDKWVCNRRLAPAARSPGVSSQPDCCCLEPRWPNPPFKTSTPTT
ncbi:MAG: hypothetical protein IT318_01580 [Anaerolineales bacterium]|nr:hypothetical protein [Anaerolineales bacterium]